MCPINLHQPEDYWLFDVLWQDLCQLGYISQGPFEYPMYCGKISALSGYITQKLFKNPLYTSIGLGISSNLMDSISFIPKKAPIKKPPETY